jgi:hypothetical protein
MEEEMAILVTDCPHCGTAHSGMPIFGVKVFPFEKSEAVGLNGYGTELFRWASALAATCQRCSKPVSAVVIGGGNNSADSYKDFVTRVSSYLKGDGNVDDLGFRIRDIWPKPQQPSVPAHVPSSVERAILQAERNFPVEGSEEASAMMYRRSLELTLKDLYPAKTGTLAKRIKSLVEDKVLPEAMGAWADEIRDLGNDAAHDAEEVDRQQLTMIRGFTDATLRYLYTLPAEVASRRKLQTNAD